jgi:hypothetical protein
MSLLLELGDPKRPIPRLDGDELLVGSDPSVCMVSGVMFGARKHFLVNQFGEATYYEVLSRLSHDSLEAALHPAARASVPFASLVEYDKAIHARLHERYPHILELVGAASAELGIGRVYRELDAKELVAFLERISRFHHQYQHFGRIELNLTPNGARMSYFDYPCYSRYFCAAGTGFLLEAVLRHGGSDPNVREVLCHCWGDRMCMWEMDWR